MTYFEIDSLLSHCGIRVTQTLDLQLMYSAILSPYKQFVTSIAITTPSEQQSIQKSTCLHFLRNKHASNSANSMVLSKQDIPHVKTSTHKADWASNRHFCRWFGCSSVLTGFFCRGCSLGSGGVAWWLRALAAHTWGPGFRSHSSPVTPWEEGVEDCWGRSLGLAVFQPSWEQYEPQVQKETMPQKHTTTKIHLILLWPPHVYKEYPNMCTYTDR